MAAAEGKVHTQVKSSTMGRFLTLADSVIRPGAQLQARDGLVGECTNVGLISALMLTMVVPMTYENVADWLEEDYPGSGHLFVDSYLGQLAGEDAVAKAAPILNDVAMIFYLIGFAGFLCSTISTVLILLCVGELQTEMGCQQFMKRVGDFTRMPYLFFMVGFYYAFAALIRYLVTVKTLGGLICLCIGMLLFAPCIALTCCFFVRCCIRAHNCMNEFEELHLADSEAGASRTPEALISPKPNLGAADLNPPPPPGHCYSDYSDLHLRAVVFRLRASRAYGFGVKVRGFFRAWA